MRYPSVEVTSAERPKPLTTVDALAFERLIADLSASFVEVESEHLDECIAEALQKVVEALTLDRITLTVIPEGGTDFELLHYWAAPGGPQLTDQRFDDRMLWGKEKLHRGESFYFSDPGELPRDASILADWFRSQGIRSHVSIPLQIGTRVLGGFHVAARRAVDWSPLFPRLKTLARIFAASIERKRTDTKLARTVAELEALQQRGAEENLYLRQQIDSQRLDSQIVGSSPAFRQAIERTEKVATTDSAVLLLGETGTGKGLFAKAIHRRSKRADKPLIEIDCTALPPTLIESELFGFEKGAFSGATRSKRGRLELAHEGTLFLDEIGELPEELQAKFLRVLETGEVSRLGSTRSTKVDVRLIAATNRDLQAEVAHGRFRSDLYYRVSVFPIVLPPLRDRRDDITLLTWYLIDRLQGSFGRKIQTIPEDTMKDLEAYAWPGNVRELRNVIERSLILTTTDTLVVDEPFIGAARSTVPTASDDLASHQRQHILSVLESCGGRIKGPGGAAERLGLKPSTLYYRLKTLGIER